LPLTDEPDQFQQNNLLVNPPSGTNGTNATFYGTEYNGDPIFIALHAIVCERDE